MAISSVFDAKTIDELQELGKLTGTEKTVISTGEETRKISVNTLIGYAVNIIASANPALASISIPSTGYNSGIIFIPEGEEIDVTERTPGCFYLEEARQTSIRCKITVPASVKVSSALGLRRV